MKTLAFIGHSHHSITKSSNFFKTYLQERYILHDFSLNPSDSWSVNMDRLSEIIRGKFDGIVLWQIDYLASFFLRRGIPVITCPMYDSSSTLQLSHWKALKDSLIICFSLELQWLIAKAGVDSVYVKYFPKIHSDQSGANELEKNTPLKAFFWERLPDTSLSSQAVMKLIGELDIDHLHIHQAPDPGRESSPIIPGSTSFSITTSSWFDSSEDYKAILKSSDIYIAPRFSEGIGMSFLEAMGYGCCVIAHDMATHNEYIRNWDNGILVNFGQKIDPLKADSNYIRKIGRKALRDSKELRENWLDFYSQLMLSSIDQYLSSFSADGLPSSTGSLSIQEQEQELESLFAAHNDWDKYYKWMEMMNSSKSTPNARNDVSIVSAAIRLERKGDYPAALELLETAIETHSSSSIYQLFRRQLIERINLKITHGNH